MKIIYILPNTVSQGGSNKSFLTMLQGLIQQGIEPLVIVPDKKGIYTLLREQNIPCVSLSYRNSVYPWSRTLKDKLLFIPRLCGRILVNSLATFQLLHTAKQFQPDIIHTNVSVTNIGFYVAQLLRLPHIWHIREYGGVDWQQFYYYPSKRLHFTRYKRSNSYTICITKDLQRHNKCNGWKNSTVIYNGIQSADSIAYENSKLPYLLYVGRLEAQKGILSLIEAYAEYCKNIQNPLPLHVAGYGLPEFTKTIHQQINQYQLADKIILLGARDNVAALYQKATALIVPSLFEGFGRITAEAMFNGCLVIGYDATGTKEQFDNGKELTGEEIALRYTTQQQLVQHLTRVTQNPTDNYKDMIFRAQKVVSHLYSTEQYSQQILDYYHHILNH